MSFRASVLTLFPDIFPGPVGKSLAGRALERRIWTLDTVNIRDFGVGRHRSVDDTPFGGGAGMVLRPDVVDAAIRSVADGRRIIALTPRGVPLTQKKVHDLATGSGVILLCGRYEGIDQRALDAHEAEEINLGDYILSGGEIAALALLDAIIRLLPGVMGNSESARVESFGGELLEYPHYTRPATWEKRPVPQILLSGDHAKIAAWRFAQAEATTRVRRPDLWARHIASRVIAP